jgi:hypothetical protein
MVHLHHCTISVGIERCKAPFVAMVHLRYYTTMSEEPDPIIRKSVSLPTSLWRRIEDYQFAHRVKRDAEAIRQLIELGLEKAKEAGEK